MSTATANPLDRLINPPPNKGIMASEDLWGTAQSCTAGAITDPANSIDLAFNDLTASCGPFADGDAWTYTAVQDTSFATVAGASLEVRFFITGLTNDDLNLQVDNGLGWQTVALFGPGSPPPGVLTILAYEVSDLFSGPAEVNAAQIRFAASARVSPDPVVIYLDEARLIVVDAIPTPTPLPPLPTPTAPLPLPTDLPIQGDPHVYYAATTSSCAACHRNHSAGGMVLRLTWPEENVCFGCHDSAEPGTDVQLAFANYTNTGTRFFKHDVAITNGIHQGGEMDSGSFGGPNRHVECEDCHEPHEATRGTASAPMLQREMNASSGVDPLWTQAGAPLSFVWLPQAEREHQICFKCHSTFTTLPAYIPDGWDGSAYVPDGLPKLTYAAPQVPDSRDMAQEFNPYNASFHPVVAQGRNQSIPAASFVNGWSQTSMTYCTDCHSNANAPTEGLGPHGSPRLHILDGQAEYSTVSSSGSRVDSQEICFKCHNYDTYVTGLDGTTNFPDHTRHLNNNQGTTCYACHDTHGSEQLHLINFDASAISFLGGRNSQTAWYQDGTGQAGCYLVCHGRRHEPLTYTP
jgi:predicted CXXCH cytochrome family protein